MLSRVTQRLALQGAQRTVRPLNTKAGAQQASYIDTGRRYKEGTFSTQDPGGLESLSHGLSPQQALSLFW